MQKDWKRRRRCDKVGRGVREVVRLMFAVVRTSMT
jgi:hypothetical protein